VLYDSGRASELGGTVNLMTVDSPVYHAVGVHFCRAESISRFDDRYAEAKILYKVQCLGHSSRLKYPYFWKIQGFSYNTVQER